MTSPIPPEPVTDRRPPTCWLTDMDGVLWHQGRALPGAADFLARLTERGRRFLRLRPNRRLTRQHDAQQGVQPGLTVRRLGRSLRLGSKVGSQAGHLRCHRIQGSRRRDVRAHEIRGPALAFLHADDVRVHVGADRFKPGTERLRCRQRVAELGAETVPSLDAILSIPVTVQVVLGETSMPVARLMKLGRGAVVTLDQKVGAPVSVLCNGRVVARGEVVVVDEESARYGVSLTEIVGAPKA